MAKVTVGPVIGKVTDGDARVLLEIDADASVTCHATADGGGTPQVVNTLVLKRGRPAAFVLSGLQPATAYTVTFSGVASDLPCQFVTMATNPTKLNVAAVSCNFVPRRAGTDLWRDMYDRYVSQGELDLVLHMGDQVYGDEAFEECVHILRGKASDEDAVRERYRRLYRLTWNHPAQRQVMARVSNLMIWDDHDIRDDWGGYPAHRDPNSVEHHVGRLARQVYREYQRQLWDDIGTNVPTDGSEGHLHVFGEIAVLFVDQRGGRTFEYGPEKPYLGTPQWNRLHADFGKGGRLSKVRALLVVTSVPLVYLGDSWSNKGAAIVDDLRDSWSYGPHMKEQVELLRLLRVWKETVGRELLVLGGDVHIGAQTDVKHNGKLVFRQLVTSPITNKPPGYFAFKGLQIMLESEQQLSDSYSFEHSGYTNRRNFGFVLVRIPPNPLDRPRVAGSLVTAP